MIQKLTFRGGIAPRECKFTRNCPIVTSFIPHRVSVSLRSVGGALCEPTVAVGDTVERGQMIGVTSEHDSPVYASISGTVSAIQSLPIPGEENNRFVIIQNEGTVKDYAGLQPFAKPIQDATQDELIDFLRRAAVINPGQGAAPLWREVETVRKNPVGMIIDGAESEPFLTAEYRILREQFEAVAGGAKILLYILGIRQCTLALHEKYSEIPSVAQSDREMIRTVRTQARYPQSDPQQLVYAVTGREFSGASAGEAGYLVIRPSACAAVYRAFATGMPDVERVLTVDGDCIADPGNIAVPIGTSVAEFLGFCGTVDRPIYSLIYGGPMRGRALDSVNGLIGYDATGILAFSEALTASNHSSTLPMPQERPCIRCGRCVKACPMHLMPLYLGCPDRKGNPNRSVIYCTECGSCTYICPSGIPLATYIHNAKEAYAEAQKKPRKRYGNHA